MIIIFILIAVSLAVALAFLALFIWGMRTGQYDDIYSPSVRVLFDDRKVPLEDSGKTDIPGTQTKPDTNQVEG